MLKSNSNKTESEFFLVLLQILDTCIVINNMNLFWINSKNNSNKLCFIFRLTQTEGYQPPPISILKDNEGLYKIVKETLQSENNKTKETYILRHTFGGIWRSCDEITSIFFLLFIWPCGIQFYAKILLQLILHLFNYNGWNHEPWATDDIS